MTKNENIKTSDLIPDDKNFNKGSKRGNALVETSFKKFGAGRSILLDKNNRVIAGNKSLDGAEAAGIEDVIVVDSDGSKIIAVRRNDIDLDSPEGRELALADNAAAKANIILDIELIEAELGEAAIEEWVEPKKDEKNIDSDEDEEDEGDDNTAWFLNVRVENEQQAQELYEKFIADGLDVKIVT